jgi:hypothetical protein
LLVLPLTLQVHIELKIRGFVYDFVACFST